MLQQYKSYLKYYFCFTGPFVINKYSNWNRNYKSYQWNSCKKEKKKDKPTYHVEVHDGSMHCVEQPEV